MKTPWPIIITRLVFLLMLAGLVVGSATLIQSKPETMTASYLLSVAVACGLLAITLLGLWMSFIHRKSALIGVVCAIFIYPLILLGLMWIDHNLDNLIVDFLLVTTLPALLACSLWFSRKAQSYYIFEQG